MSLAEYTTYINDRDDLYDATNDVSDSLPSKQDDEFAICVTDASRRNVWFIEVLNSSVNNESVTVNGPCIHLVFDNNCPNADQWIDFFNKWDGMTAGSFINAMNGAGLGGNSGPMIRLKKCEIYGSFYSKSSSHGITLDGVFKNNTINPSDDNTVKAMSKTNSAKVGAFVTYLTTLNSIPSGIDLCSFLHGNGDKGVMSTTQLSAIQG